MLIPLDRVRRIQRLALEATEIDDRVEQEAHLLAGICAEVGGEVAVVFGFADLTSNVPSEGYFHGLSEGEQRRVVTTYAEQGDDFDTMAVRIREELAGVGGHSVTCARGELIADRDWYRSSYFNDHRTLWGIDHCVYSVHRVGRGGIGMSINRGIGGAPFSAEESALIELFHHEQARLAREHQLTMELRRAGTTERPPPPRLPPSSIAKPNAPPPATAMMSRRAELSPRARDVLEGLLRGAADKEIASALGLSPHTVRQHVKAVYRCFEVSSRGELLAKLLR